MGMTYIILLNYNGYEDTIECLESLLKLKIINYQIIVIDNSETNTSINYFQKWAKGERESIVTSFPSIIYPLQEKPIDCIFIEENELINFKKNKIIFTKAKENKGFAAGNNIALHYILKYGNKDSFIWLLNNDTIVENNTLSSLIACYEKDKSVGILGAKLLYYYEPSKIQTIGGKFHPKFYYPYLVGEGLKATINKLEEKIDYAIGASLFVSYENLNKIGVLCEDYFLYYEELDWSYRAKQEGLKTDWCPEAIVYHKEGKSIGTSSNHKKRSILSQKHMFRSRKIFCEKYYKISFQFYTSTFLMFFNRIRRFNFTEARIVLESMFIK
ncbi:glycosyltransferase family 2 protein [Apibacter muscae]|uniref:Glycosyltransferase family 2 protein n=2 Tax=Apibacter muscae TaxID=2509004 RepID=A0A563DGP9_9FLAO|nr:glycosyltransferase family 2 protein [Apibacter muscae]